MNQPLNQSQPANMTLHAYGCSDEIQAAWQAEERTGMRLARVTADFGTSLKIVLPEPLTAELSGTLAHYSLSEQQPKVGDWVAVRVYDTQRAVIESVVGRRGEIARKAAGNKTVKQVIAANIDLAFVLLALDKDFSVERLKRYLYQLSINNITAVIVLNKADKAANIKTFSDQLADIGLPIVITDGLSGEGVDELRNYIQPGMTAILLGSSGVGKSTLTNRLLGREVQPTQAVRAADDTGKHTTVHRELFVLPNGGLLIDTPGIRELQLWGTEEDLDDNYDDIAQLISSCRFSSCSHTSEPDCAVQTALRAGSLAASRYASYRKMKAELSALQARTSQLNQRRNRKSPKALRRQDDDRYDGVHGGL